MKIDITYETSSFDPGKFIKIMEIVCDYAENNNDLKVYATDTSFVCGDDASTMQPNKVREIKRLITNTEDGNDSDDNRIDGVVETQADKPKMVGRCKNCDKEFVMSRKSAVFCSAECRKEYLNHRSKSRKERDEEKGEEITCPICGAKFIKHHPKQKCCTPECQKLYSAWNIANHHKPVDLVAFLEARNLKLAEKKRRSELNQRKCANPKCEKMFQPSMEDQKYCCRECKDAAHEQRKAEKAVSSPPSGKYKHICEVCQMPYSDDVQTSRFCPNCVSQFGFKECIDLAADTKAKMLAEKSNHMDRKFKVCPSCGRNFEAEYPEQFFCYKCTKRALGAKKIEPLKPEQT